ncbi:hypothetical protein PRK78_004656 [Emydomyces testavorans]|uniref:Uncharacterized protein n=1 Tax=Emydomyces testavorans TaxID=2070801 RepID=A0AAF0IJT0_9EURO|nr:hypothetical protein PRK78_004656 [Emydomyces testavorans]
MAINAEIKLDLTAVNVMELAWVLAFIILFFPLSQAGAQVLYGGCCQCRCCPSAASQPPPAEVQDCIIPIKEPKHVDPPNTPKREPDAYRVCKA